MRALLDLTGENRPLARAARAVLAAVRQADALAQRGGQYRFIRFHLKLPAALPDRYIKSHRSIELEKSVSPGGRRRPAAPHTRARRAAEPHLRRAHRQARLMLRCKQPLTATMRAR